MCAHAGRVRVHARRHHLSDVFVARTRGQRTVPGGRPGRHVGHDRLPRIRRDLPDQWNSLHLPGRRCGKDLIYRPSHRCGKDLFYRPNHRCGKDLGFRPSHRCGKDLFYRSRHRCSKDLFRPSHSCGKDLGFRPSHRCGKELGFRPISMDAVRTWVFDL